jgi:hypothetical protein
MASRSPRFVRLREVPEAASYYFQITSSLQFLLAGLCRSCAPYSHRHFGVFQHRAHFIHAMLEL